LPAPVEDRLAFAFEQGLVGIGPAGQGEGVTRVGMDLGAALERGNGLGHDALLLVPSWGGLTYLNSCSRRQSSPTHAPAGKREPKKRNGRSTGQGDFKARLAPTRRANTYCRPPMTLPER